MIYGLTKENLDNFNCDILTKNQVLLELSNNPFGKYLVYEENGKIIGYIYYSDIYDRVEINQFEIAKIHRNCGKGDKLLKEMIKIVDKSITLEVKIDNYPAISVYKKNGFINRAIRKGYYQGIDGILMERKENIQSKDQPL